MDESINIASDTLKELYYQREIIEKSIVQQTNIESIYTKCQNILKSMNDSLYRLFFKNEKIETQKYEKNETIIDDSINQTKNELETLKQINLLINKELSYHNNILDKSIKIKPM